MPPKKASAEHHLTAIVIQYIDAYNDRDIDEMLSLASDKIRRITARERSAKIQTTGKSELAVALARYFENFPAARSEIRIVAESGNIVLAEEVASWRDGERNWTQCAPSSYEFDGDKILNVTYYVDNACEN